MLWSESSQQLNYEIRKSQHPKPTEKKAKNWSSLNPIFYKKSKTLLSDQNLFFPS